VDGKSLNVKKSSITITRQIIGQYYKMCTKYMVTMYEKSQVSQRRLRNLDLIPRVPSGTGKEFTHIFMKKSLSTSYMTLWL
jgi:hypothetical protein